MTPPLFGLILAGGASSRMQRDKAALQYHGKSQLEWAFELASNVCAATFVSVRTEQRVEATRARFPQIVDRLPGAGPIAGIAAALEEHPKAAWLVLACDLPFLTRAVLDHLVAERDPQRVATAYRSANDGLPEPLCAVWEPQAREGVLAYLASGKQCPRKFLINADVKLIELADPRALDNVNTVEEYTAASAALASPLSRALHDLSHKGRGEPLTRAPHDLSHRRGEERGVGAASAAASAPSPLEGEGRGEGERSAASRKTIRVQYFAILREQARCAEETLDTSAATAADLYEELRTRHPFQLSASQLKVALNAEFSDWRTPLKHGDTVVFIPPVAGG